MPKPRIKISLLTKKGSGCCHYSHKIGDEWDYDSDRVKICPMAMHIAFIYADILRYGWKINNKESSAVFSCPDADVLNIFKVELLKEE